MSKKKGVKLADVDKIGEEAISNAVEDSSVNAVVAFMNGEINKQEFSTLIYQKGE